MSVRMQEKNRNRKAEAADFKILFEDDKTRITAWRFPPGSETDWHHHSHGYVTIQQSAGRPGPLYRRPGNQAASRP